MADTSSAQPRAQAQPTPDMMAAHAQTHGAIQAVAGAAAKMAGAAAQQSGQPHPDLMAAIMGLHQRLDAQGGAPAAAQPGDQQQQAVWSTFPSTDPQVLEHLQQTSDPDALIQAILQLVAGDEQKLHDMQMQQVSSVLNHLAAPSGPGVALPVQPTGAVAGNAY